MSGVSQKQQISVHIHWICPRDMPEVLQIEGQSLEYPWTEEDFLRCFDHGNCVGMVAEMAEKVVGFMIYKKLRKRFHILKFAVIPSMRRKGVGSQMVAKLVSKIRIQRRNRITVAVRETNLIAQFFFYSQGFRAVKVLHNHYEDCSDDVYLMRYRLSDSEDWCEKKERESDWSET